MNVELGRYAEAVELDSSEVMFPDDLPTILDVPHHYDCHIYLGTNKDGTLIK